MAGAIMAWLEWFEFILILHGGAESSVDCNAPAGTDNSPQGGSFTSGKTSVVNSVWYNLRGAIWSNIRGAFNVAQYV
eukprot:2360148-Pyramimonas_sp.AAC.1